MMRPCSTIVGQILDAQTNGAFLDDFRAFQRRVSHYGLFNSLAQTLLKITSPGVPDTYQGTEIWDFSLVDPDNRRPVDYARRWRMLQQLQTSLAAAGADRQRSRGSCCARKKMARSNSTSPGWP